MQPESPRAAAWSVATTLILGVLIVVGSRNLAHFDAALVAYTFAARGRGRFYFSDGRARFNVTAYRGPSEDVDEAYPIILATGRVVSQGTRCSPTSSSRTSTGGSHDPARRTAAARHRSRERRARRASAGGAAEMAAGFSDRSGA